jgi:nucleoside-diphosphate-sugar epimerase
MARKVLVTGAAGLIGREICKQLSTNFDVVAVDNNFRYPDFVPDGMFIKSELTDYLKSTINDFDFVFHMGAINGTRYFYEIPNTVIENNVTADLAVFSFVKTNINCKLIYASSSEIIAGTDSFPSKEETDVQIKDIHNPRWSYRLPKMLAENYLVNSNIDYVIARFFNVYSEHSGSGHFVYDIIQKIKNDDYQLVGADETRSFCYVEDAVSGLLKVFEKCNREILNIGSDEELTVIDAANIILALFDKSATWNFQPSLSGSVKRRVPDLVKLKELYPEYRPRSFKTIAVDKLTDVRF